MSKKGFVVVEVAYEYNDEIHYTTGQASGHPIHIYTSFEKAEKEAKTLNAQELRKQNPADFGYGLDEITDLSEEELQKELETILDVNVSIGYHAQIKFFCKGDDHRLYRAIGCDCPCTVVETSSCGFGWPKGATDEQLTKVAELLNFTFYKVVPVEID